MIRVILLLLFAGSLFAEEPPGFNSLRFLKGKYEGSVSSVQSKFENERTALREKYLAALKRHQLDLQKTGDLAKVLAVHEEYESVTKTGQLGDGGTEVQKNLRKIFTSSMGDIASREAEQMKTINKGYAVALEKLVKMLTETGELQAAIAAKAEYDLVNVEPEVTKPEIISVPLSSMKKGVPSTLNFEDVPELNPEEVDQSVFLQSKTWPLKVKFPKGDYEIPAKLETDSRKGNECVFSAGSSFAGRGMDKSVLILGNSTITTGSEISFKDFSFFGNLSTKFYFDNCTFHNVIIGKGGGWFGGKFMSRWQLRNCFFQGGFKTKWESHLTGIQMVHSVLEKVEFPHVTYHEDTTPSEWAEDDLVSIYGCHLTQCVIPVSVLSIMDECTFVDCEFIDSPDPLVFDDRVKRTMYETRPDWKITALPKNLVIVRKPEK